MKIHSLVLLALSACILSSSAIASAIIDWVTVGNSGNAADPATGFGAVNYQYQIGKYEVTNSQYAEFLNAKGASNANGIYNAGMSSYGITQLGNSGSYTYSVTSALANHPVVYVSWFDAARFANWMMNGQGDSSMETGSYTLNDATSGIFLANAGAQVYIPSENEWYKAAYYNAVKATYSLYPNGEDEIDLVSANYGFNGESRQVDSYSTSMNFYGTFDQAGNVWEWSDGVFGSLREVRGGSWDEIGSITLYYMSSLSYSAQAASFETYDVGFRLASVPEPTSIVLTMLASGVMLIRRKR